MTAATMRVLCVCTHNQTRSVLTAALLERQLRRRGVDVAITGAGFRGAGNGPTDRTVRLLAEQGIDVSAHTSRRIDDDAVATADLVVTAEHDHVVSIAGRWPAAFARTFTLPELVARGEAVGPRGDAPLDEWLAKLGAGRPAAFDYLDADVGEVADPTGLAPAAWDAAYAQIDELTRRLAALLG